jgi:hypothetical protein
MTVEQWEQIGQWIFSGKFPLVAPANMRTRLRALALDLEVVRRPTNRYATFKTNPEQSFYATMVEHQRTLPYRRHDMIFDTQRFYFFGNLDEQVFPAMFCYHDTIIRTIVALGEALGAVGWVVPQSAEYVPLRLFWDELKFVCYGDTAVRATLYKIKYEACNEYSDESPLPPPPLPEPVNFPQGTPITPNDGYSPNEGSEDDYEPFEGDNAEAPPFELPFGEACERYLVTYEFLPTPPNGVPETGQDIFYGVIEGVFNDLLPSGSREVGIIAGGNIFEGTGCAPGIRTVRRVADDPNLDIRILDAVPFP